jgi:hypothetical protein
MSFFLIGGSVTEPKIYFSFKAKCVMI